MQVNPYLSFKGDCEAAFKFYEECFGGELGTIYRYAGTPLAGEGADSAERIFRDLARDGQVTVPLGPTFWAERFGMVVDRFGIAWMINAAASGEPAQG